MLKQKKSKRDWKKIDWKKIEMKQVIAAALITLFLASNIFAHNNLTDGNVPANFKSDGCTLFPDGDYQDCCFAHDLSYFKGGSISERRRADVNLYKCVKSKEGRWRKFAAPLMYLGVRIGGVSFLPTPFRWGFGRKKKKKAVAMPSNEKVNE